MFLSCPRQHSCVAAIRAAFGPTQTLCGAQRCQHRSTHARQPPPHCVATRLQAGPFPRMPMAGVRTRHVSMVRAPVGCDAKTRRDAATTCDSSAIARGARASVSPPSASFGPEGWTYRYEYYTQPSGCAAGETVCAFFHQTFSGASSAMLHSVFAAFRIVSASSPLRHRTASYGIKNGASGPCIFPASHTASSVVPKTSSHFRKCFFRFQFRSFTFPVLHRSATRRPLG